MDELFPFLICLTWENYEGYSCVIFHCFLKRIAQICIFIILYCKIYIYYVVVHYFFLDCLILCWSKLPVFILRCKKYIIFGKIFWRGLLVFMHYRDVYKYIINSLPTNVMIYKAQGFVNWFYISMIGQFGFVEYTSFKYFPIITKVSQLIYWYFKYEYYKCLLVVSLSEYEDYIKIYVYATYGLVDHLVWRDDKILHPYN